MDVIVVISGQVACDSQLIEPNMLQSRDSSLKRCCDVYILSSFTASTGRPDR